MKRALVIFTGLLAACQPPSDDTPGTFEPFDASNVGDTVCHFGVSGEIVSAYFATDPDPESRGFVRFKGERIKMTPAEPLAVDDAGALSGRYVAIDYPRWEIVLDGADIGAANSPPTYEVTLALFEGDRPVETSPTLIGRCAI